MIRIKNGNVQKVVDGFDTKMADLEARYGRGEITEDEVISCLSNFKFVYPYKGWIPDRFNEVENKLFQFLHINVDLYEPTKDSLDFFYPRLVENGAIICNDYGSCKFPGAKKAVDEFLEENNYKMFYEVPMGGCFIIK